ncbi:DAHL domain-containing protein [Comamonas serinivorans]|uniref:DAHL domain-containing protein n=1 Tax=Comamonas serinivorans TaxID=1082851 RepID=UPI00146ED889|nr:DAHL domain-containing protein [Comamonas serinivorans]
MSQLFQQMRWLYVLIGTVLLLVLLALIWKAQSVNLTENDAIVAQLRDLKQMDAAWNVEVLRARAGLISQEQAGSLAVIEDKEQALLRAMQRYWAGEPGTQGLITGRIDAFSKIMREKIALIEQFKSQNAILRNSSQFLHTATQALGHQAEVSPAPLPAQVAFERQIGQVYAGVMTYLQNADDQRREGILDTLMELEAHAPNSARRSSTPPPPWSRT